MMRTEKRHDGVLFAVAGASRFGKTAWVLSRIGKAARLLAWDPRGEYVHAARCTMVRSLPALAKALRDSARSSARIAYWGPMRDFEGFAELAYLWGQLWPAVIVVEEVSDVTSSGGGRGAWGELVRKGLYYGAHLYAVTQRPQETDKTTWGNASVKHCHFLDLPIDREYMGRVLGVPAEDIGNLKRLEWIQRRAGSPEVFRGKVPPLS